MAQVFDEVVSLCEAAKRCGMHPQTLRKAYRLRELAVIRLQRAGSIRPRVFVRLSALDKWLRRHEVKTSRLSPV